MSEVDDVAVLHVDSDERVLDLAATHLEAQDDRFVVESTTSVHAALEQLREKAYDVVIAEYELPDTNGIELVQILRDDHHDQTPFIILTGNDQQELAADAFAAGANRYVRKCGDSGATFTILANAILTEVEHARAQAKLKDQEAKYRSVYENAPLAFVIWNGAYEIVEWNEQAEEVFGWSRTEALGSNVKRLLVAEEKQSQLTDVFQQALESGEVCENVNENVTADGERIYCHWYNTPLEDGQRVLSLALDITESRQHRLELQQYATALESSDDSIYMLDTDGQYLFGNREHVLRLAEDGKIDSPSESAIVGQAYRSIHSDSEADRLEAILEDVIEIGETRTEEYEFQTEEKCSYRTYSPVTDPEDGSVTGVVVISKDITKRKRAERRGEFLHSLLRHDLRNKIQIAHGYHDIIAESDDPTERTEYLDAAQDTLSEGLDLIEKIGILSELESGDEQAESRPLQSILEQVLSTKRSFAEDEGIEIEYEPHSGFVRGGPLLEELFSNVLENAIVHANADHIRISTTETDDHLIVHVEDDGVGLPDDDAMELFKRGVSAGATGGTGLGLYLVREIARSHGGDVELSTSDLGGMQLDVTLVRA